MQPRGRKKELKGDIRRKELLSAVRRLLESGKGFSDLNVEAITQEANMSRSAFYFYFESKYEVLGAAIMEVQSALIESANALFEGKHDDPIDELQKALQGVVDTWQNEKPLMLAFIQASSSDPKLWEQLEAFVGAFVQPTTNAILAIHERQGWPLDEPGAKELATALLWGNEMNLHRATAANFSKQEWQKLSKTLLSIWTGAILHEPQPSQQIPDSAAPKALSA